MADDDLAQRVEILENDVALLTKALRSALRWNVADREGRHVQTPAAQLYIGGQESTRKILAELPEE